MLSSKVKCQIDTSSYCDKFRKEKKGKKEKKNTTCKILIQIHLLNRKPNNKIRKKSIKKNLVALLVFMFLLIEHKVKQETHQNVRGDKIYDKFPNLLEE